MPNSQTERHGLITRRGFLRSSVGLAAAAWVGSALMGQAVRRRPNVLLIISDDHGSNDLSCYGAKDLVTPNLDALAGRGVRFTQFYAAAALCSASRAAILTGRYPHRAGLPGNAASQPGKSGAMPGEQVTLAEVMKAAGYVTGHVGKWHLGYTAETTPNAQGFDYSFGHMGGCIDNYSHYFYWDGPNRHDLWRNGQEVFREGEEFGGLMVRECKQFISANRDKPFFLYWANNKPHYPLQGLAKWRERYKDLPDPRRRYAAMVSTLDEEIGQVLAHLDELGLREDTIVIFQSDQGHSTEERSFGGGGDAGPYRGAKFSFFEGGIRIPAIISWPGQLPQGQVRGQMCTGCDWLPTVAELCGAKLPEGRLDGKSIRGVIDSADAPSPHAWWHWAIDQRWAVREGDWKLLFDPNDTSKKAAITAEDKVFLVNLAQDVTEMKNLAKAHPEVVQRLTKLHEQWLTDVQQR